MEFRVREKCIECNGTGRNKLTDVEARQKASRHNYGASQCNMGGNYLSAKDFIGCGNCGASGYIEKWVVVNELMVTESKSD